jgi:hypothetical protein
LPEFPFFGGYAENEELKGFLFWQIELAETHIREIRGIRG